MKLHFTQREKRNEKCFVTAKSAPLFRRYPPSLKMEGVWAERSPSMLPLSNFSGCRMHQARSKIYSCIEKAGVKQRSLTPTGKVGVSWPRGPWL